MYAARLLHTYYSGTYLRAFWSSEVLYYFYPVTLVMWLLGKVNLCVSHNCLSVLVNLAYNLCVEINIKVLPACAFKQ